MTRLTSGEKLTLRGARTSGGRRILTPRGFHASIAERNVIYAGQVDGSPRADAQTLGYYEFVAKNVTGEYLEVQPHMSIDLGTISGGRDLGTNRIRPNVVSPLAEVRIAEIAPSLFPLADNLYFSVIEEYRPWLRLPRGEGSSINGAPYTNAITMYIDYNRPYFDGNDTFEPKANITRSATAPYAPKPAGWVDNYRTISPLAYRTVVLSSAFSFTFTSGGSISGRLWDIGDGTIIGGGSTSTETITVRFPPGFRYITLRVVDNSGNHYGFMRYPIWVHDDDYPPLSHFQIPRNWTGDWRELELDFFEQAVDETVIPKGVAICVWEDDPFWGEAVPDAYRDQMLGWCKEDTTLFQKNKSRTTLVVTGMGEWFNRSRAIPQRIQDPGRTPISWFEMEDITLDRLAFYLYNNFSTGSLIGNFYRSGINDVLKSLDLTGSSLFGQMQYSVQGYYGKARFDSLNQLILKRHYSYMTTSERAAVDPALELTAVDHPYDSPLKINRRYYNLVAALLGAGASFDGSTSTIYNARAPGRTPGEGSSEQDAPGQNLPASGGQDELTRLTASHYKYLNNERDSVPYDLLPNLDALEVAWGEPITISEVDADSGLDLNSDLFMVKEISIVHEPESARGKRISLTLEGVTTGALTDAQMVEVIEDETDPVDSEPPIDIILPPITTDPIPVWDGQLPTRGVMCSSSSPKVALAVSYTIGVSSVTLTYEDRSGNLAALGVGYCIWAYSNPYYYRTLYVLTNIGLCGCGDINATTPVWTLLKTNAQLFGDAGRIGFQAFGSHMVNGWGAAVCGGNCIAITFDAWATVTTVFVDVLGFNAGIWCHGLSAWLCGHNPNYLYAFTRDQFWVYMWRSTDGGLTWVSKPVTTFGSFEISGAGAIRADAGQFDISIPYSKVGGAANLDDGNLMMDITWQSGDASCHFNNSSMYRSVDGADNFTYVPQADPYPNYLRRVCNPVAHFTHDAAHIYLINIGLPAGGVGVISTDDNFATSIIPAAGFLYTNISAVNGWSPNENVAIAFAAGTGGGGTRLFMTFDHGTTWLICNNPPDWTAASPEGIAYAEFSLYTIAGMP